jgi:ubiquinone/menaquinone biosynthesis C-methylase UbiE
VTVLDVSAAALEKAKQRLGGQSGRVNWIEADVTEVSFAGSTYDLWHDRAAFHFQVDTEKRAAYVAAATRSVKPGGYLLAATFAANGPTKCSGLPIARYSADELARQFPEFACLEDRGEQHQTPSGAPQNFTYVLLQKRSISGAGSGALKAG